MSLGYDKTIFARNLNYYLAKNGENQIDIVRFLGVSKSTVSAYCSGSQVPRIDKIELLAQHFGIEKSDLIEEKEPAANGKLSEEARLVAEIIDRLPPEGRRLILAQVRAAEQALLAQASAPESPKSQ